LLKSNKIMTESTVIPLLRVGNLKTENMTGALWGNLQKWAHGIHFLEMSSSGEMQRDKNYLEIEAWILKSNSDFAKKPKFVFMTKTHVEGIFHICNALRDLLKFIVKNETWEYAYLFNLYECQESGSTLLKLNQFRLELTANI